MKILIAPDKFKGSLSAKEVCSALAEGLRKSNPIVEIIKRPMADGGDGSLEVLAHYLALETVTITVKDPLFRPVEASYQISNQTAYIEMSAASGLVLLQENERNCLETSSIGTGELIKDALEKGATQIYLFIGGSATNDGGVGIAYALGYRFWAEEGNLLKPIGKNLGWIDKIDSAEMCVDLEKVEIKVICDVNNPFYGKNGAAYVYAPQKGADTDAVELLDNGLKHLASQFIQQGYDDIADVKGAGAAGGVGGGMMAFFNANLVSGIQTFLELTQLEREIKSCDLVITGEGKLDTQTEQGKVISGVCALAQKYDKPIIAVCGAAEKKVGRQLGLSKIYTILERSKSVKEAMEKAAEKLVAIGKEIAL
ncbi:MAG: glycerate kinase [Bacteroidota bacterium]